MNNKIPKLQCAQQVFWVGIGCQTGASWKLMETAIEQVFTEHQLEQRAIAGLATIDTKAKEVGLIELCRLHHWPLKTFAAEILQTVCVPNPAKIIAQKVGTPSVAEAAAILAATCIEWSTEGEKLSSDEYPYLTPGLATVSVRLLVPKQIFRKEGELGAVTVAVTQGSVNQQL